MNILVSLVFVSISKVINCEYSSPKCEQTLRFLEASKEDALLQQRNVLPKISCLICSRPTCDPEAPECEKKSGTPEIPLYQNILEFGFMKDYIPKESQIMIRISEKCFFNMTISSADNVNLFGIKIFECPNDQCDENFDYHEIEITPRHMCLQIGMMFIEKASIHFALTANCKYVPTVYFDPSKKISIKTSVCNFNETYDIPKVSFLFMLDNSFPLDGVPILLPCTSGGYVVDSATGRFYEGQKCEENFKDPNFPVKNFGLGLVIDLNYKSTEHLLFPKKSFERFGISPYPIYIGKDGKVLSVEQIIPKRITNPLALNKTRSNCVFKDDIRRTPCDEHNYFWDYEKLYLRDANYSNYVPRYSCFICVKPECDYYSPDCDKWATSPIIPIYNQILEFGLFGSNMPILSEIKVALTPTCHLKVTIVPLQTENLIIIQISECYLLLEIGVRECLDPEFYLKARFSFPKDCLFLGLGFADKGQVFVGLSLSCISVPTAHFCHKGYFILRERVCLYNLTNDDLFVQYRFQQTELRYTDGVPIILPCSSGGYVADLFSGRFRTGAVCTALFSPPKYSDKFGIEFVIKNWYNNNENLFFPSTGYKLPVRKVHPIYIQENLGAKSTVEMKPIILPHKMRANKVRNWCYLSNYKRKDDESEADEECRKLFYVTERRRLKEKEKSSGPINGIGWILIFVIIRCHLYLY